MIEVLIVSKKTEATDICSLELASVDGSPLPEFSAGSHIDIHLPDGLTRQYSLCNPSSERHRYQIAVLKDPASRGGSLGVHQLKEGTHVHISEPRNLFSLAHGAKRSLLFAGGIGVTPILCMAERLSNMAADFEMHYCTRSADRTAFVERIKTSSFAGQVHFHHDDGPAQQKLDAAQVLGQPESDVHVYVCGPTGFMEYVLSTAKANGWPEEQLHREYFAAAPTDTANDGSFDLRIASTGQTLHVPAERTALDVLLEAGFDIPMSCEQGICGTCLTRVLDGAPDHRDMFMTEEEQAANDQFTPCCSRAKSAVLVLDI
ncbi:PDR/VanB family oxidoreductase [Pseudomonas asuensis]|uniref:Ferredoxin:oxidoreductase FAD/NAD(P)-binding subunit n=1 Tax=Pseudomonas asuensis TaxID=1825787 RepID=A0ABQ2GJG1_9PSED|nr:PDR/VanB family oxidoreductase [Pseudomonas asuensis]GGL98413.1 ferredoxin:oxidoreductase FAD/NAD(P)-binding subunit [Pseudomonas asuensis]